MTDFRDRDFRDPEYKYDLSTARKIAGAYMRATEAFKFACLRPRPFSLKRLKEMDAAHLDVVDMLTDWCCEALTDEEMRAILQCEVPQINYKDYDEKPSQFQRGQFQVLTVQHAWAEALKAALIHVLPRSLEAKPWIVTQLDLAGDDMDILCLTNRELAASSLHKNVQEIETLDELVDAIDSCAMHLKAQMLGEEHDEATL